MADGNDVYTTMSIASLGDPTLRMVPKPVYAEKRTNDVSDIDGARSSTLKYKHYFNKSEFSNSDVPGATSKILHHGRNVRDNSLYIDDIPGTRHLVKDRMMRTNRHVNPLEPEYSLPRYTKSEYDTPKFIKDPLEHKDIEGSMPKPKKVYETRDIMGINDIVGAQANWRPRHAKCRLESNPHDLLEVGDIAAKTHRYTDKTSRSTHSLDPVYQIHGTLYGTENYMKPKPSKKLIPESHLLQTRDIDGAYPGWIPPARERREYNNTNFIADIQGAHADSIRPGITTKRTTNPLTPVYQALDPGEVLAPLVHSLIPPELVKIPTLRQKQAKMKETSSGASGGSIIAPSSNTASGGAGTGAGTRTGAEAGLGAGAGGESDLEPVLFTADSSANQLLTKPPTGRSAQLALDLKRSSTADAVPGSGRGSGGVGGPSRGGSGRAEGDMGMRSASATMLSPQMNFGSGFTTPKMSTGRSNNSNGLSPSVPSSSRIPASFRSQRSGPGIATNTKTNSDRSVNINLPTTTASNPGSSIPGSAYNSGRGSGRLTPAEKRAERERMEEITLVRQLQGQ